MKKCSKCKCYKKFTEFNKDNSRKDNLQNKCKDCKKLYYKYNIDNYENNKEVIKNRSILYYYNNRDKKIEYQNKYSNQRIKTDELFKLLITLRKRIRQIYKNKKFIRLSSKILIGEELEFVKIYLENQFTDSMNWNNHGKWHIDHIIPLSSANTEEELIKLCHYSNLQPLWAKDNLSKGNKIL